MRFWRRTFYLACMSLLLFCSCVSAKPFEARQGGAAVLVGEVACYGEHEIQQEFLKVFHDKLAEKLQLAEQQGNFHFVDNTDWMMGNGDARERELLSHIHMDVIAYAPQFQKDSANAKMIHYAERVFGEDYFWNEKHKEARKAAVGKTYRISQEMTDAVREIGSKYGADYLFFCNLLEMDVELANSIFNARTTNIEERPKHIRVETSSFLVDVKTGKVYEGHILTEKFGRIQNLFGQYGKAMTAETLLGAMFDVQSEKIVKDVFGHGKKTLDSNL